MFREQESQPSTCNPEKAPPTAAFMPSLHVIQMSWTWNINIPHPEIVGTRFPIQALLGLDRLQICLLSVLNFLLVLRWHKTTFLLYFHCR